MAFFSMGRRYASKDNESKKNPLENAASPHYRHFLCAVYVPCWSMKPSEAANDSVESEQRARSATQHNDK